MTVPHYIDSWISEHVKAFFYLDYFRQFLTITNKLYADFHADMFLYTHMYIHVYIHVYIHTHPGVKF